MTSTQALGILGLQPPVTADNIRAQAGRLLRSVHSDTSGGKADAITLHEILTARDWLLANLPGGDDAGARTGARRSLDGALLSELGHGLGPLRNGQPCTVCDGRGYTARAACERVVWTTCPDCAGIGVQPTSTCAKCGGSGRHEKSGGKCFVCDGVGTWPRRKTEIVCPVCRAGKARQQHPGEGIHGGPRQYACFLCSGTGKIDRWLGAPCARCNPDGIGWKQEKGTDLSWIVGREFRPGLVRAITPEAFIRCSKCGGTGETEVFNPALRKGLLAAMTGRKGAQCPTKS